MCKLVRGQFYILSFYLRASQLNTVVLNLSLGQLYSVLYKLCLGKRDSVVCGLYIC